MTSAPDGRPSATGQAAPLGDPKLDAGLKPVVWPFDDGGCFGCSPSNADGLKLKFFTQGDEVRADYTIEDRFHGAPGVAHGGILAVILDEFSCAAAVFLRDTRVVTGELSVRYEQPCPVEEPLHIRARVTDDSHPRYLIIQAEVFRSSSGVAGDCLARSTGKFFPDPA